MPLRAETMTTTKMNNLGIHKLWFAFAFGYRADFIATDLKIYCLFRSFADASTARFEFIPYC